MLSRSLVWFLVGAAFCAASAGCGRSTGRLAGPDVPGLPSSLSSGLPGSGFASPGGRFEERGFYPLDIGNWWFYRYELTLELHRPGQPEPETETLRGYSGRSIECEAVLFGRSYRLERGQWSDSAGGRYSYSWLAERQDAAGLYELDAQPPGCDGSAVPVAREPRRSGPDWEQGWRAIATRGPVESAALHAAWDRERVKLEAIQAVVRGERADRASGRGPGGPQAGEIQILRYPLHPGQRWFIRQDPPFVATVEGSELLRLPAGRFLGFRVRIDSELLGPQDRVHAWYGPEGFLMLHAITTGEATDPEGNLIGTLVVVQIETLEALSVATARSVGKPPGGGG